ncbi:SDR family NAD(P)-dependent oxidoreductase [Ornithinibacillus bavariensis]|uniref:Oxidoreductase n=1 Tax=Ornithinibacillus bavariensis TaxID=545502 RepID=A0A919XDA3_9BACI|nr:SDR family oxidoreductase [Ornithinibacillus bavariensis]GIO28520.1 oxidoreductase [Ornithinibacillus bavariensis]HAM81248.1 oxidoreductase [Ornithinibacillus sp.]
MQSKLTGKKIVVTGASSGIGEMLVKQIASAGGTPIMLARSLDKLRQLQKQLKEEHQIHASFYMVDLTDEADVYNVVNTVLKEQGTIHALINNAGAGVFQYVIDTRWEDIELMYQLNVLAVIRITKLFLPHFMDNNEGHIINIASQAGKISTPKSAVYASTKHAILGFTNALRQEVARNQIQVTAVNLGPVRTNFFALADPEGNYQKNVEKYMLDPGKVAEKITKHLLTNKREINAPLWMDIGSKFYQLFPGLTEKVMKKQFNKK